mmetsp:Transcript_46493/g.93199  ORF Transcript_46493/g.93199 Transcript_46493/m.93199 type:complete len:190 (-) Transcript_46493:24-593(-)
MKPLQYEGAKAAINSAELRNMQLLAYLTGSFRDAANVATVLARAVPYRVPLSAVQLRFLFNPVAASQALIALNGTLVGLCTSACPPGGSDARALGEGSRAAEAVGLGVVRAVDPASRTLYLLTPLPLEQLQRVDVIVRGKLELPLQALNYHPESGRTPYLVVESLQVASTGSSTMKSRSNILRRGQATP